MACGHCGAANTVSACGSCGRHFVVTSDHAAGRPRGADAKPLGRPPPDPPARCDACATPGLAERVSAGLRQRTCPACGTELLSAHGLER